MEKYEKAILNAYQKSSIFLPNNERFSAPPIGSIKTPKDFFQALQADTLHRDLIRDTRALFIDDFTCAVFNVNMRKTIIETLYKRLPRKKRQISILEVFNHFTECLSSEVADIHFSSPFNTLVLDMEREDLSSYKDQVVLNVDLLYHYMILNKTLSLKEKSCLLEKYKELSLRLGEVLNGLVTSLAKNGPALFRVDARFSVTVFFLN